LNALTKIAGLDLTRLKALEAVQSGGFPAAAIPLAAASVRAA
jgi:hypothetical protein